MRRAGRANREARVARDAPEHWSPVARWSLRFAIVAALVLAYAVLLHRYEFITSPAAFALLCGGAAIAALALVFGLYGILTTWVRVVRGMRYAIGGVLLSGLLLTGPLYFLGPGLLLPRIHDISTDLDDPPDFTPARASRPDWANDLEHPGGESALADDQRAGYPEVTPLFLEMQTDEAFDIALKVIRESGWRIVAVNEPVRPGSPGQIEAIAYTLVMAFPSDVALRVTAVPGGTMFDMRSVSRYGVTDLGRNAALIVETLRRIEDQENL